MSYHNGWMPVITTVESRLSSIRRKYTDTLHLYRRYQQEIIDAERYGGFASQYSIHYLAAARRSLRRLSAEHRSYRRALELLTRAEAEDNG